ncbi:hypothetical protein BGZ54_008099 [Gamsiella multidivaricata]|nr:hypothetical protein BGZ54_008099 [Gamsiella multidivaricata]
MDDAHRIVEREILKFGTQTNLVLYLDGLPSEEKGLAQLHRKNLRKKAVNCADKCLRELEVRVDARRAFAIYMRKKRWRVVERSTEADLIIDLECKPGDIVVSKDSDMLMYKNVETIWRPISKGKLLVYNVPSVYAILGLILVQFTVLGVV